MGRNVRLRLSTVTIVLGDAFVAGTLVFTDTLSRSFGRRAVRVLAAVFPARCAARLDVLRAIAAD